MNKKDLGLVTIIGAGIGVLIQPMLTTLSDTLASIGIIPTLGVRLAVFLGLLILAPLALTVAHYLAKLWSVLYQFAKFGAVGTLNTMIDFGVLNLLIAFTGIASGVGFSVFKAISFLAGTTNSFFWNKFWTFGANEKTSAGETAKFYIIAISGWVLNVAAASVFVNGIPAPETVGANVWANLGALVGVGASFLWNFLGYKFIVFKKRPAVSAVMATPAIYSDESDIEEETS